MAAAQSEGEAQKLRFGPWLVSAVSSGSYQGLCWTDPSRSAFRVPWKHNARKDITSSDLEVFKAWAQASGRYEACPEDPAKWKTNFRCALRSTRMFVLLDDRSKCGDDPHKVFAIVPGEPGPMAGGLGWGWFWGVETSHPLCPPAGSTVPPQSPTLEDLEALQWVLQQCDISPRDLGPSHPPWAGETGDTPHQDTLLQPHPEPRQNSCLPPSAFQQWVPTVEQPPVGNAVMGWGRGRGAATCPLPGPEQPPPRCARNYGIIPSLDVSIYYRGRLFHQEEVGGRQCLLAYQPSDPAVAERPGRLVRFPSPAEVADSKQRRFTEELLGGAGLQLEQRARKLFATRLKKCKVFWALSQQLEDVGGPPSNLLFRDQETPIFDFNEFCTELRDFRNGQRQRSPDFTIYLCFGQSFAKAKPKESKLILVKLVPKFCEYWYEQVLREGASSLDSGTVSLQLSDSFSLFELIEHCNMQID
uniref:Interferon regulatory factor 7 n=1 Tax=Otus sunia TaxID=257818 RepID=A0A8C8A981_9STRI